MLVYIYGLPNFDQHPVDVLPYRWIKTNDQMVLTLGVNFMSSNIAFIVSLLIQTGFFSKSLLKRALLPFYPVLIFLRGAPQSGWSLLLSFIMPFSTFCCSPFNTLQVSRDHTMIFLQSREIRVKRDYFFSSCTLGVRNKLSVQSLRDAGFFCKSLFSTRSGCTLVTWGIFTVIITH